MAAPCERPYQPSNPGRLRLGVIIRELVRSGTPYREAVHLATRLSAAAFAARCAAESECRNTHLEQED
jgi:hypothetical protein